MQKQLRSYNNIFITGMPGCGKTYFGLMFAHFSKRTFIDFDDFFEKTLKTKISKVFAKKGEEGFRKDESRVVPLIIKQSNCVIALGGGTLQSPHNFKLIQNHGLVVSLVGLSNEILAQRIWQDKQSLSKRKRTLFFKCQNFEEVLQTVRNISDKREQTYQKSDLILNQQFNSTDNLMLAIRYAEKIL